MNRRRVWVQRVTLDLWSPQASLMLGAVFVLAAVGGALVGDWLEVVVRLLLATAFIVRYARARRRQLIFTMTKRDQAWARASLEQLNRIYKDRGER